MAPEPQRVHVRIKLGPDGILRRVQATGHAGQAAVGGNLLCAAITVLLRSVLDSCSRYPGVEFEARADQPGHLEYHLKAFAPAQAELLRGASDVLLVGLAELQREYPQGLAIVME